MKAFLCVCLFALVCLFLFRGHSHGYGRGLVFFGRPVVFVQAPHFAHLGRR